MRQVKRSFFNWINDILPVNSHFLFITKIYTRCFSQLKFNGSSPVHKQCLEITFFFCQFINFIMHLFKSFIQVIIGIFLCLINGLFQCCELIFYLFWKSIFSPWYFFNDLRLELTIFYPCLQWLIIIKKLLFSFA